MCRHCSFRSRSSMISSGGWKNGLVPTVCTCAKFPNLSGFDKRVHLSAFVDFELAVLGVSTEDLFVAI